MQMVIIAVTFFLGVAFGIVAVVALFTRHREGKGTFKFAGVELSGSGAPILFLFVGAVLMLSGFGWASSQKEVAAKDKEVKAKTHQVTEAVQEKTQAVREAAKLYRSLEKQLQVNQELTARVPSAALQSLKATRPELMAAPVYQPSAKLRAEIARVSARE